MTARLGDRSLFPSLTVDVYLNHAAVSPVAAPVKAAVDAALDAGARTGVGGFPLWLEQASKARKGFADLIGASPEDVALVANTSQGVVDVALSLPWRPRDRIVWFEGEFPANVTPWLQAARLFDLEPVCLPLADWHADPDAALERLEAELRRGVRLVAVSAVQFSTGLRMPVEAMASLCHAHGAEIFVDGIQACGVVPLDAGASGIDYLAAGSHKWLMGTFGNGCLYVRPDRWDALEPRVASWISHQDGMTFLNAGAGHLRYDRPFQAGPALFEGGAFNVPGIAALGAGLQMLLEVGVPATHRHVNAWIDRAEAGLLARGFTSARSPRPEARSGILSIRPPHGDVLALSRFLDGCGASCATPDGWLRMAPHWPNALDEVARVLDAVDAWLNEAQSGMASSSPETV